MQRTPLRGAADAERWAASSKFQVARILMPQRNTLICTVGTSLFEGNLSSLSATTLNAPTNWADIRKAYDEQNWKALASEMLKIAPTERLCGAEINTIEEVQRKNWLSLENLVFLVSDTPNGKNTGEFLRLYFEQRKNLRLRNIEYGRCQESCRIC